MSWRIPVTTQEPVHISPDIPVSTYERKRYSISPAYGVVGYLEPPSGFYWILDSVQIELSTTANVGERWVYLYHRNRFRDQVRYKLMYSDSGWLNTAIIEHGMAYTRTQVGVNAHFTITAPLHTGVLQPDEGVGALLTNFNGGDSFTMHANVREYKVA